jgi:hypothetical protein
MKNSMYKKAIAALVAAVTLVTSLGLPLNVSANFPDQTGAWADNVVSFLPQGQADGGAISADLQNAWQALGASEWDGVNPISATAGVTLGFKGQVTLKFDNAILNTPGKDVRIFTIHDGTNPFKIGTKSYYKYRAKIEASQNCWNWKTIGYITGDTSLELGGLNWANCIQITDVSWRQYYYPTATGFRLESVQALHSTADTPWLGQVSDTRWWRIDGDTSNDTWMNQSINRPTGTYFCRDLWIQAITFHNNYVTNPTYNGAPFQSAVYNTAGRSLWDGKSMTQIHDTLATMTCTKETPKSAAMRQLRYHLLRINKGRDLWTPATVTPVTQ